MLAAASAVAAATGLRLCGMVEEPPRPSPDGSNASADIGLHQQRHVARDLAACAGKDRETRSRVRDAVAMGMPGRIRQRQLKHGCEFFRDQKAVVAERRQRAGGAAELQRQALACAVASTACASDATPRHTPQALSRTASAARAAARCAPPWRCRDVVAPARQSRRWRGRDRPAARRSRRARSAWSRYRSRPGWWRPNAHNARHRDRFWRRRR